jgi:hypothetical protein
MILLTAKKEAKVRKEEIPTAFLFASLRSGASRIKFGTSFAVKLRQCTIRNDGSL